MSEQSKIDENAGFVKKMMMNLGEDTSREGLVKTPQRVAKSLKFLTSGYDEKLEDIINGAVFEEAGDEMVVVQGVELYSLCEHHMLPFFGQASVAYIPNGKIIGLSKVARITDMFARRLQVQERLTQQIAHAMQDVLDPLGVAVIVEAKHFCMMMRGVQKQNSFATTSCMLGAFKEDAKTRAEFMNLVSRRR
ncbi:MAG: GTP cyclohydrolase I FolE [Planctomycetota bacterium]|nr:GTP cyclohydrolase I FolE [Planctomycetota bacterium]